VQGRHGDGSEWVVGEGGEGVRDRRVVEPDVGSVVSLKWVRHTISRSLVWSPEWSRWKRSAKKTSESERVWTMMRL
jgi:hypothetical protein